MNIECKDKTLTSNIELSTSNVEWFNECSLFKVQRWMFDVQVVKFETLDSDFHWRDALLRVRKGHLPNQNRFMRSLFGTKHFISNANQHGISLHD